MRSRRASSWATLAGAVRPSSSSTPSRSLASAPRRRLALDLDEVLLVHAEARVGEAVGEVAVVGEQQQALGVAVEATDREHPGLGGHEVDHGRPALRVRRGGDHPGRLVEQVVDEPGLHADLRAVDLDDVDLGIDPPAEHRHLAVHAHAPSLDQVLAGPAAAQPRLGQHLLEADAVALVGHRRLLLVVVEVVEVELVEADLLRLAGVAVGAAPRARRAAR